MEYRVCCEECDVCVRQVVCVEYCEGCDVCVRQVSVCGIWSLL